MVAERTNALVYLITSSLVLKVGGSNPGHPETFIFVSECRDKNELIRDLFSRTNSTRFSVYIERKIGVLCGFRHANTNVHVYASVYACVNQAKAYSEYAHEMKL